MGVAVSNWQLARAVSIEGQLGVVSGTLLAVVYARRLQDGDPGGYLRRAAATFPIPRIAEKILAAYHIENGKPADQPYKDPPMPRIENNPHLTQLTILANYTEVHLAKHGHDGLVGINLLEKIQIPTLASLYGAMLAKVDYVLMGAGIPRAIPGILDALSCGQAAELRIDVTGAAPDETHSVRLDPAQLFDGKPPRLPRPQFLAIVSGAPLATTLARKSNGTVNGFVIENETAGGHNAPPRGPLQLTPEGEPVYGSRDTPDFRKIADLSLPFWIAGSTTLPGQLAAALRQGAAGIQVGTAFAFCEESGFAADLKRRVRQLVADCKQRIFTDPQASPTGFPFKTLRLPDTLSELAAYAKRNRLCDLGYLREAYKRLDGGIGYRCAAENALDYLRKKGEHLALEGRKCLCNALLSAANLAQTLRENHASRELPLITVGNDLANLLRFTDADASPYTARDVLLLLLNDLKPVSVSEV